MSRGEAAELRGRAIRDGGTRAQGPSSGSAAAQWEARAPAVGTGTACSCRVLTVTLPSAPSAAPPQRPWAQLSSPRSRPCALALCGPITCPGETRACPRRWAPAFALRCPEGLPEKPPAPSRHVCTPHGLSPSHPLARHPEHSRGVGDVSREEWQQPATGRSVVVPPYAQPRFLGGAPEAGRRAHISRPS